MTAPVLAVVGRGLVDIATPVLTADDSGFTHGEAVFETMRIRNGLPFLFAGHVQRLRSGAARMDLPAPDLAGWQDTVAAAAAAYGDQIGVLRLFCTPGPAGAAAPVAYVTISPVPAATLAAPRVGTHAVTLDLGISAGARAGAPWLLPGIKTTSYAVAMAAKREARRRGATEAIWLSSDGEVLEEATSTVVWVREGAAYTIPESTGVLGGTTLDCLRGAAGTGGVPIIDRRTPVADLRAADEVLLLSAVRGVASVLTLDAAPVGKGAIGLVGTMLQAAFEQEFAAATERSGVAD